MQWENNGPVEQVKIVREYRTTTGRQQASTQHQGGNTKARRTGPHKHIKRNYPRPPTDFRAALLSGMAEDGGGAAAAAKIFGMTIEPGNDTNRLAT